MLTLFNLWLSNADQNKLKLCMYSCINCFFLCYLLKLTYIIRISSVL